MIFYSFRSLVIAYAILIAVVLLVLLATFFNFQSHEKQLAEIRISREALKKLEPAISNVKEFEFELNNYINSGGEQNLNFFAKGIVKLKKDSLQIIEITNSDSAKQAKEDYQKLVELLHRVTGIAGLILYIKDNEGFDAASAELKKEH